MQTFIVHSPFLARRREIPRSESLVATADQ
jgi:hypothetical protein